MNITHMELALDIPVTQEVLQEPEANVVKVAFTVRKAGRYEIAVKLGGLNVAYSPYYKIFQPGKAIWVPRLPLYLTLQQFHYMSCISVSMYI